MIIIYVKPNSKTSSKLILDSLIKATALSLVKVIISQSPK